MKMARPGKTEIQGAVVIWSRASEEHIEYAHTPERLAQLLTQAGFLDVTVRRDGPQADAGRIFLTAMRSLEYGV